MPIDVKGNKINKYAVKKHGLDGIIQRGLAFHIDATSGVNQWSVVGDLSGNDKNGTMYTGTCLHFDGADDYVESTSSILRTLKGVRRYSVSMWVNSDDHDVYKSFWGIYNTHELHVYTTALYYYWHNGGSSCVGGSTSAGDDWHFIVATFDAGTQKLYRNGVVVDTESSSQTEAPTAGTTNMFVGKMGSNHYDGKMTDVKVWNETLTPGEIMELYKTPNLIVPSGRSTNALELWWPLTEGSGTVAHDASGHGHHGTINGAAWAIKEQNIQQPAGSGHSVKMEFDGSNDYLSYGTTNLPTGNVEVSLSCWVRPTTVEDAGCFGYGSGTYDSTFEIYLYSNNGAIKPAIHYAGGNSGYNLALNLNEWNHIAATYDKTSTRVYVNGVLSITDTQSLSLATSYRRIGAMNYGGTPGEFFDGQIDECAMWNTVLNASDIKALAATSTKTVLERSHVHNHSGAWVDYGAPKPPDARKIASKNLVAYWRNVGASKWPDLSGNGNDATVSGAPSILRFPKGIIEERDSNGFPSKIKSFAFDGSNKYINVNSVSIGSSHTIMCWTKMNVSTGGDNYKVLWDNNSDYIFGIRNDKINHYTYQSDMVYSDTTLVAHRWYHIVMVRSSSSATFYLNGVADGTVSVGNRGISGTNTIGSRSGSGSYAYDGLVGNILIYNRELSADEIKHNYKVDNEKFKIQNY